MSVAALAASQQSQLKFHYLELGAPFDSDKMYKIDKDECQNVK